MKHVFVTSILLSLAISSFGQAVENDDMYFNSKDRLSLKEQHLAYASTKKSQKQDNRFEDEQTNNPTDSYSSRNVNPEYAARINAEQAQEDNQDYYLPDYKHQTATNMSNWNNNFNNWYTGSWYNSSYYSPSIYGWNSPYYGSYYDSWGNPWNNPYYQSGWSSSFSYYHGNNWNYGWGMNYNYGCPYNSFWGPSFSFGYGSPWAGSYAGYGYSPYRYGYGYPSVVVVDDYRNNVHHGKRSSRSSYISRTQNGAERITPTYSGTGSGSRSNHNGGRVSGTPRSNQEYYNRTWRNQNTVTNSSGDNGATNGRTRSTNWSNDDSNSGWNNDNSSRSSSSSYRSSNSNSSYSPSRSSSGYDGGSRSSGGSSSGSGSRSSHGRGGH